MIRRLGLFHKAALQRYLESREPFTTPIYGNLLTAGFIHNWSALRSGVFYGSFSDHEMNGVMAFFNDGNLMIHTDSPDSIPAFHDKLPLQPFHSVWGLASDHSLIRLLDDEPVTTAWIDHYLMVQKTPCPVEQIPGSEIIRAEDHIHDPEIIRHIQQCLVDGFDIHSPSDIIVQRLKERRKNETHLLLRAGGVLTAQAHIQAMTYAYGYIGGVATLAGFRKRGYAAYITAVLCDHIRKCGLIPCLTVRKDNAPAIHMYKKLGFENVGDVPLLDCDWDE